MLGKSFVLVQEELEIGKRQINVGVVQHELEEDVTQVGCRNWRLNAQSREEWWKLIEGVKSHPGMFVVTEEEEEYNCIIAIA
jgi:hypothetical protein